MNAEATYQNPLHNAEERKKEFAYRIEHEIEQTLNPTLHDLTSGLARGLTETLYDVSAEQSYPPRHAALDYFDQEFMTREIRRVKGNLTQYARDALGATNDDDANNLRRNVYRQIEKYGLNGVVDDARPWKPKSLDERFGTEAVQIKPATVESTLASTLSSYKSIIHPELYDGIAERIHEKAPVLAERISTYAPTPLNRLKDIMSTTEGITNYSQARTTFERQLVYDALESAGFDKDKAARYLGDSVRTLNRRISELGIETTQTHEEETRKSQEVILEEAVKSNEKQTPPPNAVDAIERFRQLQRQYDAKRESAREQKAPKKRQVQWKMAA